MKKLTLTCLLLSMVMAATIAVTPIISVAQAAEGSSSEAPSKRVRRTQTLRPEIYEKLEAARVHADEGRPTEALNALAALEKRKRNSYEQAMTYNMYAYVYFNQEQLDKAAQAYEQVLAVNNIPESLEQTTQYSLAKLYLMGEKYEKAISALNKWFAMVAEPGSEAFILRAQMNFQLEKYAAALPDVEKAIAMKKEQGNPPENWFLLERAALYQNKDFKGLARCLQDLVALYPKGDYWVQLAAVYSELGQPKKELSALETAYDQKLLTRENERINLAQALLGQDVPFKAAMVIKAGMDEGVIELSARNLSLLGDAWMLAKEYDKAIEIMGKAAEKSQSGKDYYKLAQIHTERQEWELALNNVDKAIKLGGLNAPSQALILKGLALYNLNELDHAAAVFADAAEYPEASAAARQWEDYIDSERKRLEYMASSEL
ncbi:tetratricopeptide repeat protein [Thalassolituus oleivorans]|uniref:Tetratricopeptide repeat protein n=1 Tax=Thalassolituus oleivorans MIL-1 TaxID=1298593 RepID=M5E0V6_9GAMM|nr:tetratricopeptide repeat protein [Thalassolituus oleivorans]AHK16461.1 membrane protein [Thalassolituus oleivorans R6-15]CCU71339.1 putative unknown membrane associated protein [Thalassolituus oleivorans MIL-1]